MSGGGEGPGQDDGGWGKNRSEVSQSSKEGATRVGQGGVGAGAERARGRERRGGAGGGGGGGGRTSTLMVSACARTTVLSRTISDRSDRTSSDSALPASVLLATPGYSA